MQNRRQRLILPFMKRRRDPVTWIYDHRAGVFSLVALALVMAILFIGSKIVIRTPRPSDGILVALQTEEELREEVERRQRENRLLRSEADMSAIRNAISNLGAELHDNPDNMAGMREMIDQTNQGLRGNRDTWDQGLREIEAMKVQRNSDKSDKNANSDSRVSGNVLVEFSLVDPLRQRDHMPTPGYRSESFGEVVVDITVNRNGDVVAARVNDALSDKDPRMREVAADAAKRSRFNINPAAPERHTGTITYTFVAQ